MSPKIVSQEEWTKARKTLLAKEKELTRQRDEITKLRGELPMVRVDKKYVFEGPSGKVSLAELFGKKTQLLVYHLMFDPSWEAACKSCSIIADTFNGSIPHFGARDVAFAAVSRAPLAKLLAFQARMGWKFPWVSSLESDFNFDFHVSFAPGRPEQPEYNFAKTEWKGEAPGLSTFMKQGGDVFHTYSTYGRGLENLIATYNYLDLVPKGRDESTLKYGMEWVRLHDSYEATGVSG